MDSKDEQTVDEFIDSINQRQIRTDTRVISDLIEEYSNEYLSLNRQDEKLIQLYASAKHQFMYIFYKTIQSVTSINKEVPDSYSDVKYWLEKNLITTTNAYKIFSFVNGVIKDNKYENLYDNKENKLSAIIHNYIKNEDILQYLTELMLLFIKRTSEKMADFNWKQTKKMNGEHINTVFRMINNNNTNPDIFIKIYEFGEERSKINRHKKTKNEIVEI